MIRVENLTHSFDGRIVLNGVNIGIEKGETVAIMGTSGGGKTTLLRCMSTLLKPSSGTVNLWGTDPYHCSEKELGGLRKRIGVVFQAAALFDYLSVEDNVSFGLVRHTDMSKKEREDVVAEKLGLVGLAGEGKKMPSELSGGMKKRVGVARALASGPELLFYDEPTSGLDPVTAYSMDALIREVANTVKATSVVVTHDLHSVLRVADRVIFLSEGEVISDGSPKSFVDSSDERIRKVINAAEAESLT